MPLKSCASIRLLLHLLLHVLHLLVLLLQLLAPPQGCAQVVCVLHEQVAWEAVRTSTHLEPISFMQQ